jgi:aminomethyltransferase
MFRKTALHEAHKNLGAKMGEFAGYDMPLYYGEGVIREHEWVRGSAGLFDVSHMGQITIEGEGVAAFLESITPSGFAAKKDGRAQYTVLTNEKGGIIDDLIITKISENKFFAVINAGCKDKDLAWIRGKLPAHLKLDYLEDNALIALQGPAAERVMRDVFKVDLADMPYMSMLETKAPWGCQLLISRLGYTGEDGFEISLPNNHAAQAWGKLLTNREVKPVGLAARDSLRLEMGYALYGHDIDQDTSPVEADLTWVISRQTRDYLGYARISGELAEGPARKRVGFKLLEKGIAREGAEIRDSLDKKIGVLTSGGFSPSLKESIGQGYIESSFSEAGQKVFVNVRGRNIAAEVTKMPFIPARTKSMKKKEAA